jgi:hypothetical protein
MGFLGCFCIGLLRLLVLALGGSYLYAEQLIRQAFLIRVGLRFIEGLGAQARRE